RSCEPGEVTNVRCRNHESGWINARLMELSYLKQINVQLLRVCRWDASPSRSGPHRRRASQYCVRHWNQSGRVGGQECIEPSDAGRLARAHQLSAQLIINDRRNDGPSPGSEMSSK